MGRLNIHCAKCQKSWIVKKTFSLYEQQVVESCPCPHCGSYTLCCRTLGEFISVERSRPVGGWRAKVVRA